MPESLSTYRPRVRGFWNTTHDFVGPDGSLGVLGMRRNAWGVVSEGRWTPTKGEQLHFRRDPGLLRSQFSIWTPGREWLGSSLRSSFLRREVVLHTGSRPLRLLPLPGFHCGWTLQAPRTGEMARLSGGGLLRSMRVDIYRKVEFELVIFAYFLGWQIRHESVWPGPWIDEDPSLNPAPKAPSGSGGSI